MPFRSPHRCHVLTEAQLAAIRQATLRLLAEVGVHLPSPRAQEIMADHGAMVEARSGIVRMPADLVEKAMASAPRSFVLAGRQQRLDLVLDGSASYLCTDGCGVEVIDPLTRQRRRSRKDDVARVARIADALPMIGFFWPPVSAADYGVAAPVHECHAGLTNTLKHVRGGTTMHPRLASYVVEMALAVAGDEKELRRRPPVNANICTISPLGHDGQGLDCALKYAAAGIPVSFMAMPTMGSTAPATPLGALVQGNAEIVSGMVLLQLAFPGTPVWHALLVSLMHPLSGGYVTNHFLALNVMAAQIAHSWGVPSLEGGSVSTDASVIGWQSGMESGLGAAFIAFAGAEVCGFLGLLGGSMLLCPEQIILDYEACEAALEKTKEFFFRPGDMALEVIAEVGPRGHFLAHDHTRRHLRDFRFSRILHLPPPGLEGDDPVAAARVRYGEIEKNHRPAPLPDEVNRELARIVAAADREAANLR